MRRIVIRNQSSVELGVMLEPSTEREDVEAGGTLTLTGDFAEDEIMIDFADENFLSIWSPTRCIMSKL